MTDLALTPLGYASDQVLDRTAVEFEVPVGAMTASAVVVERPRASRRMPGRAAMLLLLTCAAVLMHGYHLGADDAEIYLPAIKRVADPQLYPFNAQFFLAHSHLSLFAWLTGGSARLLHLPVDVAIFAWQVVGIFALMFAAWRMASLCFAGAAARWGAVAMLAATMSVPVAGTAVPIMDPYLDSRSLSTPMILLAIAAYFGGRKKSALAWLAATVLVHPLMAVYGVGLVVLSEAEGWIARRRGGKSTLRCPTPARKDRAPGTPAAQDGAPGLVADGEGTHPSRSGIWFVEADARREEWGTRPVAAVVTAGLALVVMLAVPLALPKAFPLGAAQGAYREALYNRPFLFVFQWHWFEWVGVFAPLAILYGLGRWPLRGTLRPFRTIIGALMPFAGASIAYAVVLGSTHQFDYWARLQPMRSFHLIYLFLFLFLGGVLGEFVLKQRVWRWLALFVPLGTGMYLLAHADYPHSAQVEWPTGQAADNPWLQAFFWIRGNTPKDAVFALNPVYLRLNDTHGFRAVAERSALADGVKDSGAVSMFPELAPEWQRQQQAQAGWTHFGVKDFERLRREYGVDWVVEENPAAAGLVCPYRNAAVSVCRVGAAAARSGNR
ncbi:MAG: hypothetical protein ACR2JE_11495 [Acidobacteriaceae bacterium]